MGAITIAMRSQYGNIAAIIPAIMASEKITNQNNNPMF
jgi:hypothetical protein